MGEHEMTPHAVLESIDTVRLGKRMDVDPRPIIARAVHFDFGRYGVAPEHTEFGVDLFERGLFDLPFPAVFYSYTARGGGERIPVVACNDPNDGFSVILLAPFVHERGTMWLPELMVFGFDIRKETTANPIGPVRMDSRARQHCLPPSFYHPQHPYDEDRATEDAYGVFRDALALTVMLMSKGVSVENVPAPDRLNKARRLKGRPDVRAVNKVVVDTARQLLIDHDDGSHSDITGHKRGTPRLHWRRGHFRTLNRGTDEARVVPVAPALVGANDGGFVPPKAKTYEIKK
jgi:hypothetical protein